MKRLNNGMVLLKWENQAEWSSGNIDGTVTRDTYRKWYYATESGYDAERILNTIINKRPDILPLLMDIDKDLDKIIEEKTRKDVEIN